MNFVRTAAFTLLTSAIAASAFAQTPPPPAGGKHGREMQKRWADADLDKDGQLSKTEAQVAGIRMVTDNFDAIDANKDGKVSQDEIRAWGQGRRGEHRPKGDAMGKHADDKNHHSNPTSGFKSPDERRAAMEERFKKADTNSDGALSKAEVQVTGNKRFLEHFDAIDANKDGKITAEELRIFGQKRQGEQHK